MTLDRMRYHLPLTQERRKLRSCNTDRFLDKMGQKPEEVPSIDPHEILYEITATVIITAIVVTDVPGCD